MTQVRKHDFLNYQKTKFYSVANTCYLDRKLIICGYLFIEYLTEDEILINSHTGYAYLIKVPNEFKDTRASSQCNVSLPFQEAIIIQ